MGRRWLSRPMFWHVARSNRRSSSNSRRLYADYTETVGGRLSHLVAPPVTGHAETVGLSWRTSRREPTLALHHSRPSR